MQRFGTTAPNQQSNVIPKVLHCCVHLVSSQIRQRSVGTGRASGTLAFELVPVAKTLSSHIALVGGGAFLYLPVAQEVEAGGPQGRTF